MDFNETVEEPRVLARLITQVEDDVADIWSRFMFPVSMASQFPRALTFQESNLDYLENRQTLP